jgi:hypothetical protein
MKRPRVLRNTARIGSPVSPLPSHNLLSFSCFFIRMENTGNINILILPKLEKLVSGGQNGADRAALEAAVELGIPTGGWAPEGFITTTGSDLTLRDKFHLQELKLPKGSIAQMYVLRSMKNVDMADGTIAFRLHNSVGTDKTIQYSLTKRWGPWTYRDESKYKPTLVISELSNDGFKDRVQRIRQFIIDHNIKILNVAGHREAPLHVPDFSLRVRCTLMEALKIFQ